MALNVWLPTATPNTAATDSAVFSYRNTAVVAGSNGSGGSQASLGQVRVTFSNAAASGVIACNNVSIGVVGAATAPNCTTNPPVELLFTGTNSGPSGGGGSTPVSGYNLPNLAVITSEWANLNWAVSDVLLVIQDTTNGNTGFAIVTNGDDWKKAGASYTLATVSGFSSTPTVIRNVTLIETQAGPGAPTLMGSIWM